jgi:FtsP/CotA-like multicopper oxidase with cupredoxin domain
MRLVRAPALVAIVTVVAVFPVALAGCDAPPAPPPIDHPAPQQPEGWDEALRIPEAPDLDPAADVVAVELEARLATLELTPGKETVVWTYNGQLPGPTIRARRGDRVVVTFRNALPEPTTVHWHGLRVPASMDGTELMQEPVLPGGSFVYDFIVPDAGTYWYHPHVDSSAQVGFGLYGAFIVEEPDEPRLGDELVLVLSDMGLDAEGQLLPGDHQGWFGDFFGRAGGLHLVNGRVTPPLGARAGAPQRWRVVNAARSHYVRLGLPEEGFTLVGADGGLLEAPRAGAEIMLPPGARAEAVFVPRAARAGEGAREIAVEDTGVDVFHIGRDPPARSLFSITVVAQDDGASAPPPPVPTRLAAVEALDLEGARERVVSIDTVLAEDGNTYFGFDGALGHHAEPFVATTGTVEVWELKNTTNMDHPFHLHGFFFQVLDVNGAPPPDRAWLDTVNIEAKKSVRVAIPFDDRAGMWMFHCHVLDHGDTGMMRMLSLEAPRASP